MNWEQAKGKWTQVKGSVRKKWGKLTDDDLDVINGERERLVGKIQERYGIAKEEAENQVAGWNLPESDTTYERKAG
ncbi:MAG: CsbD family protein [Acidobacteria bacterium]|nr:MAG: CsbD family protein [Acidobacteriota bacterium]